MSQSHGIKGGTTDYVVQEQCSLLERVSSVGAELSRPFTCKRTLTLKNRRIRKKQKRIWDANSNV